MVWKKTIADIAIYLIFGPWNYVCIAPFQVRSKFAVFAPHIEGSNADFVPHTWKADMQT